MQQPGGDGREDNNTHDGGQQFAHVHRFEIRFWTVVLNPATAEQEVHNGNQHTNKAQRKRHAPAEFCGEPWSCQHGEEWTNVDGHVVHGECTVQTWVIFAVAGREQGWRVRFEQSITNGDGCHTHIDYGCVMTWPGNQTIADCQNNGAQHNDTLRTQNFITKPAANRDQTVNEGTEWREQRDGIGFGHTQLFYQVNGHDPLQAVITKTLP